MAAEWSWLLPADDGGAVLGLVETARGDGPGARVDWAVHIDRVDDADDFGEGWSQLLAFSLPARLGEALAAPAVHFRYAAGDLKRCTAAFGHVVSQPGADYVKVVLAESTGLAPVPGRHAEDEQRENRVLLGKAAAGRASGVADVEHAVAMAWSADGARLGVLVSCPPLGEAWAVVLTRDLFPTGRFHATFAPGSGIPESLAWVGPRLALVSSTGAIEFVDRAGAALDLDLRAEGGEPGEGAGDSAPRQVPGTLWDASPGNATFALCAYTPTPTGDPGGSPDGDGAALVATDGNVLAQFAVAGAGNPAASDSVLLGGAAAGAISGSDGEPLDELVREFHQLLKTSRENTAIHGHLLVLARCLMHSLAESAGLRQSLLLIAKCEKILNPEKAADPRTQRTWRGLIAALW